MKDGYNGDVYSVLCKNIATTALKDGYHIIRSGYYTICGSTAQSVSCNRCVPYKGDVKYHNSRTIWLKSIHNDAKNTCGLEGKNMSRRTKT